MRARTAVGSVVASVDAAGAAASASVDECPTRKEGEPGSSEGDRGNGEDGGDAAGAAHGYSFGGTDPPSRSWRPPLRSLTSP